MEDTFHITVNPVNDPATVDSQIVTVDEDGTLSITFTAHDPDLPDVHTVGFRITDATDHGTLVPLGPVSHDGSGTYTQQFRFTPSANYNGADGFQFKFMEWTGFDSGTNFTGTFAASSVYLADLDNDGDDDVAMSSYNSDPWHAYNQVYSERL